MKKFLKIIYKICLYLFAAVGIFFVGGYTLTRFHITDITGTVDSNNLYFQKLRKKPNTYQLPSEANQAPQKLSDIDSQIEKLYAYKQQKMQLFCRTRSLSALAGGNVKKILRVYEKNKSDWLRDQMVNAVASRLAGNPQFENSIESCGSLPKDQTLDDISETELKNFNDFNVFPWTQDSNWATISEAMRKDAEKINHAAEIANVDPRLIVSVLFVEQSRLYNSQRELFKKFFEPLKILSVTNKFSLGVMAMKQETAEAVENKLKDPSDPSYLGKEYEHLLDFASNNPETERYKRLTNNKDQYYSYLYGAIYIRQIQTQWERSGFPIADRPEIIATLFNIGFKNSHPQNLPQVGGSTITINNTTYSFGALAYEFYYSGELADAFAYTLERAPNR